MSILNRILLESSNEVKDDTVDKYLTIEDKVKSGFGFYKPTKKNIRSRWIGATAYRLGMPRPQNRQAAKGWDWARQDKEHAYEKYLFKSPRKKHIVKEPEQEIKTESKEVSKVSEKPTGSTLRRLSLLYPYSVPKSVLLGGAAGAILNGGLAAITPGSDIPKTAAKGALVGAGLSGASALFRNYAYEHGYNVDSAKAMKKSKKKKPGAKP